MTGSNWSVPETEVVQRIRDRLDADGTDVLATVVDIEGNAYRRPGAKMLLNEGGEGVGVADEVRDAGEPRLVTYDLMEGEEEVWGLGVGCNGVIEILLEPLTETYRPAVDAFTNGRDVAVVTVLDGGEGPLERGDRAYHDPADGSLSVPDGDADAWPTAALSSPAAELADRGRGGAVTVDSATLFVDGLSAPPELVVFGTGHDVGPVTELAAKNDFRVTVVGFRGAVDLAARFPAADRTLTTSPGTLASAIDLGDDTYAVVMTHNFVDDRLTVEALLDASVPYVGLMGPRDRFEEMLAAFEDEGQTFADDDLAPLYTPVGLDLGGGSPYQIAHSIVAEVLAVANGRTPRHLQARAGPIHDRVDVDAEPGVSPR
ncbi:MAG: XdhC family protein [Haloplanus sp.]